jgi:hypothetical protein
MKTLYQWLADETGERMKAKMAAGEMAGGGGGSSMKGVISWRNGVSLSEGGGVA